jgi:hypothetical protein
MKIEENISDVNEFRSELALVDLENRLPFWLVRAGESFQGAQFGNQNSGCCNPQQWIESTFAIGVESLLMNLF